MSKFAQRVDVAVDTLSKNTNKDVDENDFIDASRLVYDGVREIRRAVLMNRVSIGTNWDSWIVLLVSLNYIFTLNLRPRMSGFFSKRHLNYNIQNYSPRMKTNLTQKT